MLNGTLDDFTLADVLRLAASARRTGRLDVTRDSGGGRLWFRDGAIAAAEAGYGRQGLPAPATAVAAIEELTFDLMRWDLGEFSWTPEPGGGPGEAAVDVDDLLRDVSRRLDELAEIRTLVPSEDAVLAMAPHPPEGAVQISVTPSEWRVLVLVDGRRSVAEIAAAAGLDDLGAMKVLFGLAAAGLVAADSGVSDPVAERSGEAPRPSPPAPEAAPAVDRSTAARELAGLFDLGEPLPAGPRPPGVPRRVEDDDQITRGLVARLVDGVKGL